jgi:hypothetical protein
MTSRAETRAVDLTARQESTPREHVGSIRYVADRCPPPAISTCAATARERPRDLALSSRSTDSPSPTTSRSADTLDGQWRNPTLACMAGRLGARIPPPRSRRLYECYRPDLRVCAPGRRRRPLARPLPCGKRIDTTTSVPSANPNTSLRCVVSLETVACAGRHSCPNRRTCSCSI